MIENFMLACPCPGLLILVHDAAGHGRPGAQIAGIPSHASASSGGIAPQRTGIFADGAADVLIHLD
jgi:hypothetical protein